MAHFAKVLDGFVVNVIVAEPEFFETFVDSSPGDWIQTSYNTHNGVHYTRLEDGGYVPSADQSKALRKNFAGVGFIYDKERDAFYPPKPKGCDSWTLNEETCLWEAPVPYPTGQGGPWEWNESNQSWDEVVK